MGEGLSLFAFDGCHSRFGATTHIVPRLGRGEEGALDLVALDGALSEGHLFGWNVPPVEMANRGRSA